MVVMLAAIFIDYPYCDTTTVNSSVARTREYLTGKEVEKLMEAARKSSRYGHAMPL
jgi:hypothetical protein